MSLPPGDTGRALVGNTFTFHSAAHETILRSTAKHHQAPIIRMNVLRRHVGLVLDHSLATTILMAASSRDESLPRFSHREAYGSLLSAFFEEPNILLEDEDEDGRKAHREQWDGFIEAAITGLFPVDGEKDTPLDATGRSLIRAIVDRHVEGRLDRSVDLYTVMKEISQEIVLGIFLGLTPESPTYHQAEQLSTTSLRGQFAAPLPVRFGGWIKSAYSRGLEAKHGFDSIVSTQISSDGCPFLNAGRNSTYQFSPPSSASLSTHTSMFSSGLIVKAVASYLASLFMQLYRPLPQSSDFPNLAWRVAASPDSSSLLDSLLFETERLCPPIIGVMRRVQDRPLEYRDLMVPEGWDVWLYFPLINRDPGVYGPDSWRFDPDRFLSTTAANRPITFGAGGKQCLGQGLIREIARCVVGEVLTASERGGRIMMELEGGELGLDASVRDFLGWTEEKGTDRERSHWRGVKQLPVQRPKDPVMVRFSRQRLPP